MGIRFSALPPDLQRQLLQQAGLPAPRPRRPAAPRRRSTLMRVCSCRCEIFRPDGVYPERCDGCGGKWPDR